MLERQTAPGRLQLNFSTLFKLCIIRKIHCLPHHKQCKKKYEECGTLLGKHMTPRCGVLNPCTSHQKSASVLNTILVASFPTLAFAYVVTRFSKKLSLFSRLIRSMNGKGLAAEYAFG